MADEEDHVVEMEAPDRPYMLRPSDDIDVRDSENPLLVTDYVNEMYNIFNEQEVLLAVNHKYMTTQPYVNEKMRCILIDWMVRF